MRSGGSTYPDDSQRRCTSRNDRLVDARYRRRGPDTRTGPLSNPDAGRARVRGYADVATDLRDTAAGMRRRLGSKFGNLGISPPGT